MRNIKNIFNDIPKDLPEELFETLSGNNNVNIQRIVSQGHSSPEGFYYDQESTEFIILLSGQAKLLFEDTQQEVTLNPGDHLEILPHRKHRVEWTKPKEETVWLVVHYSVE